VLSSQIEGTQSSLSDLLLYENAETPGVPLDDVQEVSNYVAALNHGLKRMRDGFPLSLRLIREIHEVLLSKGRGSHAQPGQFRKSQNWIGGSRPGNGLGCAKLKWAGAGSFGLFSAPLCTLFVRRLSLRACDGPASARTSLGAWIPASLPPASRRALIIAGQLRNFAHALEPEVSVHAQLAVKDEYTFAFLELENEHSERELERALTGRVEAFLPEMGDMFTFVGSQYKLQVGEREFFIDLLLYHRRLHALVALELKIGEFEPEYIGKMQFYLSVLDDTVRLPEERPSIGIILCKSKDRLIVEYALKEANLPIGVSSYSVTPSVPNSLVGQLPSPSQIAALLAGIE